MLLGVALCGALGAVGGTLIIAIKVFQIVLMYHVVDLVLRRMLAMMRVMHHLALHLQRLVWVLQVHVLLLVLAALVC